MHWRSFETETAGLAACNNQPVYLMSFIPNRKNRRWLQHEIICKRVLSGCRSHGTDMYYTRRETAQGQLEISGVAAESGGRAPGRCAFQNNVIQCRLRHWGFSAGSCTGVKSGMMRQPTASRACHGSSSRWLDGIGKPEASQRHLCHPGPEAAPAAAVLESAAARQVPRWRGLGDPPALQCRRPASVT